jgi:hypothetical protein
MINGYVDALVSPTVTTRKQSLAAVKINIKNLWKPLVEVLSVIGETASKNLVIAAIDLLL